MSEFGTRTPEALRDVVRTTENEYEESLREIFLADKLFHDSHLMQAIAEPHRYMDELGRLQGEFLNEKRGKNMGERFELALSDKYLGKIHVVELGSTTNPGVSGEIDGLKDEYRDLLRWMVQHGIVSEEISREDSQRTVGLRKPVHPEACNQLLVMVRNRTLIHTTIAHEQKQVSLGIAKRMVFSMPLTTVRALNAGTERKDLTFTDERSLRLIETMLENGTGGIEPIRTSYYLATEVAEVSTE